MGRGHEGQDPEEATQYGGHPGQEQPCGQDRSVQGTNSAGMERPGLQKEEEAEAAARSGKDNMNKSTEAKEWSNWDGRGSARGNGASRGGGSGKRGKSMETGQERPEKKRTRTGISGGPRSRTGKKIQGRSGPGLERRRRQK